MDKTTTKKKSKKKWIVLICVVVVIAIIIGVIVNSAKAPLQAMSNFALAQNSSFTLEKGSIVNSLAISGAVETENSRNVYSTLNYTVAEVLAKKGDRVKEGDVLAILDTADLNYDIIQAENNLQNALITYQNEQLSTKGSIDTAEGSLSSSLISKEKQETAVKRYSDDLKEAQEKLAEGFDSFAYDNTVREAQITLDRKISDLQDAKTDLEKALNDFDSYTYINKITDAATSVERAVKGLNDTHETIAAYNRGAGIPNLYASLIEDNGTALNRAIKEYNNTIKGTSPKAKDEARTDVENAISRLLRSADSLHSTQVSDESVYKITNGFAASLNKAITTLSDSCDAYIRATNDLTRAQDDAVEKEQNNVTTLEKAVDDAERALNKATEDRKTAADKDQETKENSVKTAQRAYDDALTQLESLDITVGNSENSLSQAKNKTSTAEITIANQEMALEKLRNNLEKSVIKAPADGVIVESNIKEGTVPSGILFVIDDTEALYTSVKVKEYNVGSMDIGQPCEITTDATDDEVFKGEITYISPKAVSAAGNTNVEFEVWVKIHNPSEKIRIGMNAFVNIILEEKRDIFTVPATAILTTEEGSFIYTNVEGIVNKIPVSKGVTSGTNYEIIGDGLQVGMIVLNNPGMYTPGLSVDEMSIPESNAGGMAGMMRMM